MLKIKNPYRKNLKFTKSSVNSFNDGDNNNNFFDCIPPKIMPIARGVIIQPNSKRTEITTRRGPKTLGIEKGDLDIDIKNQIRDLFLPERRPFLRVAPDYHRTTDEERKQIRQEDIERNGSLVQVSNKTLDRIFDKFDLFTISDEIIKKVKSGEMSKEDARASTLLKLSKEIKNALREGKKTEIKKVINNIQKVDPNLLPKAIELGNTPDEIAQNPALVLAFADLYNNQNYNSQTLDNILDLIKKGVLKYNPNDGYIDDTIKLDTLALLSSEDIVRQSENKKLDESIVLLLNKLKNYNNLSEQKEKEGDFVGPTLDELKEQEPQTFDVEIQEKEQENQDIKEDDIFETVEQTKTKLEESVNEYITEIMTKLENDMNKYISRQSLTQEEEKEIQSDADNLQETIIKLENISKVPMVSEQQKRLYAKILKEFADEVAEFRKRHIVPKVEQQRLLALTQKPIELAGAKPEEEVEEEVEQKVEEVKPLAFTDFIPINGFIQKFLKDKIEQKIENPSSKIGKRAKKSYREKIAQISKIKIADNPANNLHNIVTKILVKGDGEPNQNDINDLVFPIFAELQDKFDLNKFKSKLVLPIKSIANTNKDKYVNNLRGVQETINALGRNLNKDYSGPFPIASLEKKPSQKRRGFPKKPVQPVQPVTKITEEEKN
jgi:hypothetical protein